MQKEMKSKAGIGKGVMLTILVSGILIFTTGCCGQFDPENIREKGPKLTPTSFFKGQRIGHQMIMDRNRNIKEIATIHRDCVVLEELSGQCVDQVKFHYSKKKREQSIQWSETYLSHRQVELNIIDQEKEGSVFGIESANSSMIYLEGEKSVPLDNDRKMSVSVRYQRLRGPGDPVLQTEVYKVFGITMGIVETFWIKK